MFHRLSKHLKFRQKYSAAWCLDIPIKHCFSCLIYYIVHSYDRTLTSFLCSFPLNFEEKRECSQSDFSMNRCVIDKQYVFHTKIIFREATETLDLR